LIAALFRIRVACARQESLPQALADGLVAADFEPGFLGLEVLRDRDDGALLYLLWRWSDERCLRAWHDSEAFGAALQALGDGDEPVVLERVHFASGRTALTPAAMDSAPLLAELLHGSQQVLFAECDPDGMPRLASPAFARLLDGRSLWQCLSQHDAAALRERLARGIRDDAPPLRLELRDARGMGVGLDCRLAPRPRGFVLLAERADPGTDSAIYDEVASINNELSAALREKAQRERELDRALATLEAKNEALEQANRRIEELSRSDALTGVHNRRHLDETLAREVERARRQGSPLAVAILDLDHFKAVNDCHGHAAGDAVLAATGRTLSAQARPYDTVARYGGEEFVLVLPGAGAGDAVRYAERLRAAVEQMTVPDHAGLRVTASFGAAVLCGDDGAAELLRRADAALYRAKAGGRNRVELDRGETGHEDGPVQEEGAAAAGRARAADAAREPRAGTTPGIALECDREGQVLRVLRDDLGTTPHLAPGAPLAEAVAEAARSDLAALLECAWCEGAVFDRPIALAAAAGAPGTLHAAAARHDDTLLVVISRTPAELVRMQQELMRINNEQANALRETARDLARARIAPAIADESVYDALTEVNNELADLQREMSRRNAELARLNEEKSRLLGMAAHDLRTPLGVVQSYAEFLDDEARDALDAEQREFVHTIRETSRYMHRLVDDLLEVSRIESGRLVLERTECDLAVLLERHVALQQVLANRKQIRIELHGRGPLVAAADAGKIGQVLDNLLANAVAYSPRGTCIRVSLTQRDGAARVAVSDQGPGIHAADRERLFQPFATAGTRATGGETSTGLGLAIARRIVEGHGGSIGVDSEPGAGATFWFCLPREQPR